LKTLAPRVFKILQQRQMWSNNKEPNIAVDNGVLVKDSDLPPAASP